MSNFVSMRNGSVLPIFPLPNFVIFPGVVTRLHVFEPRYLDLFSDVLDSHGFFCISTLVGDWQADYHSKSPRFNDVGCVCLVRDYDRLEDGRYNIVVQAIARVTLEEVPTEKVYRSVRVSISEIDATPEIADDRIEALRLLAESVLEAGQEVDSEQLKKIVEMEPVSLVTTMSFYCPAPSDARLELLESASYAEMAPTLMDLYTQELCGDSPGGASGDSSAEA